MLKSTTVDPQELSSLVEQLASDQFEDRQNAENRLLQLGKCSHTFLAAVNPGQPEVRRRVNRILERFAPLEAIILRYDLTRNIPFLARHFQDFPDIELRLKSVLPDVDLESAGQWWQERGSDYQWDHATDRYVPIQK